MDYAVETKDTLVILIIINITVKHFLVLSQYVKKVQQLKIHDDVGHVRKMPSRNE